MSRVKEVPNVIKYKVTCSSCGSVLGIFPFEFINDPDKVPYCQKCPFDSHSVDVKPLNTTQKIITKRVRIRFGKKRRGKFPNETDKRFGERYAKTGEIQTIERIYDRRNDNYREVIVNCDGKVKVFKPERLSGHRNVKK